MKKQILAFSMIFASTGAFAAVPSFDNEVTSIETPADAAKVAETGVATQLPSLVAYHDGSNEVTSVATAAESITTSTAAERKEAPAAKATFSLGDSEVSS